MRFIKLEIQKTVTKFKTYLSLYRAGHMIETQEF